MDKAEKTYTRVVDTDLIVGLCPEFTVVIHFSIAYMSNISGAVIVDAVTKLCYSMTVIY